MSPTTGQVLRRSAGASILYGVLFVISVPFFCLLGFPPAAVLTRLVGRQLDGLLFGASRQTDRPFAGFWFFYVFVIGVVLTSVAGTTAVRTFLPEAPELLTTLAGTTGALILLLAVALPYAFVPLVARDPAIVSAVGGHSFLLAARAMTHLPVARRALLVVASAGAFLVPLALFLVLERQQHFGWALLALVGAFGVLVPVASAVYVAAYGQVRERLEREPLEDDPVALPAIVRATGASAVVSAAALFFLLVAAGLAPSTMQPTGDRGLSPEPQPEPVALPGTDVLVRSAGEGVTVAARDGGGVGHVVSACGPVVGVTVEERPDGQLLVLARCESGVVHGMRVNARGVRLDDGIRDRLRLRTGGWVFALLGLVLLLGAFALGGPWRALQRVRYLRSLARSDDAHAADDLRALEGTLRSSAPVVIRKGAFRCEGPAQVVGGGSLRITLPPDGPAMASDEEALLDGSPIAVVGRFERGVGGGLREGAAPWPEDGLLVPGGRRAAAERLTGRASKRLAALLAALTLVQVVGALVLTLGW